MVNIRIYGYSDTLLVIFSMRVCSQNSGTYCMVPLDWDLALTCICGPNFRSNSSENSPDFLFVCLFVWLNKPRTVKPLRRFHSWSSIFTQDGLAFSTQTARPSAQDRYVPGVQEEFRENGVETEKNRDKSSNCDVCVTCDDVRCLL